MTPRTFRITYPTAAATGVYHDGNKIKEDAGDLEVGVYGGVTRHSIVSFDRSRDTAKYSTANIVDARILLHNTHWHYSSGGYTHASAVTLADPAKLPLRILTSAPGWCNKTWCTSMARHSREWVPIADFKSDSNAVLLGWEAPCDGRHFGRFARSATLMVTFETAGGLTWQELLEF